MPLHILLLEDDKNLGLMIQDQLHACGYQVTRRIDGKEGLAVYHEDRIDLCLVDVMLPEMDGFAFAREIRRVDAHIPIIFLTARALKEDKIEGFTIGADDYLTKPFTMEELILRIQAVLKRTSYQHSDSGHLQQFIIGRYRFDYERHLLKSPTSEQKLTGREADLLRLLCLHLNHTLDRSLALKTIWGDDSYFNGRSMDVFISRLRRYFQEDQTIEIINIHGKGFKLIADSPAIS